MEQVKRRWWNSVVEQWNSDGGTVIVKQCGGKVEQCGWNSVVEQFYWNSGTVMLEQCRWNSDGGTLRWNSVGETVWWTSETVEYGW